MHVQLARCAQFEHGCCAVRGVQAGAERRRGAERARHGRHRPPRAAAARVRLRADRRAPQPERRAPLPLLCSLARSPALLSYSPLLSSRAAPVVLYCLHTSVLLVRSATSSSSATVRSSARAPASRRASSARAPYTSRSSRCVSANGKRLVSKLIFFFSFSLVVEVRNLVRFALPVFRRPATAW